MKWRAEKCYLSPYRTFALYPRLARLFIRNFAVIDCFNLKILLFYSHCLNKRRGWFPFLLGFLAYLYIQINAVAVFKPVHNSVNNQFTVEGVFIRIFSVVLQWMRHRWVFNSESCRRKDWLISWFIPGACLFRWCMPRCPVFTWDSFYHRLQWLVNFCLGFFFSMYL